VSWPLQELLAHNSNNKLAQIFISHAGNNFQEKLLVRKLVLAPAYAIVQSAKLTMDYKSTGRIIARDWDAEEAIIYELHIRSFSAEYLPVGDRETGLTRSLAAIRWLLGRIPALEMEIYASGRTQFADEFQSYEPEEAAVLIDLRTYRAYQQQINDFSIEEARLHRQYEQESAELKRIQQRRKARTRYSDGCSSEIESGSQFSIADLEILEEHLGLD
jgi:hypothetical protein